MVLPPLPHLPVSSRPSTTLESPTHAPNLARRTTMALLPVGSRPPAHPPPSNFPQPPHDSMAPQRHPFWLKQPPRPLNYAHPPVLHLSTMPTTPSLNRRRRQPPRHSTVPQRHHNDANHPRHSTVDDANHPRHSTADDNHPRHLTVPQRFTYLHVPFLHYQMHTFYHMHLTFTITCLPSFITCNCTFFTYVYI